MLERRNTRKDSWSKIVFNEKIKLITGRLNVKNYVCSIALSMYRAETRTVCKETNYLENLGRQIEYEMERYGKKNETIEMIGKKRKLLKCTKERKSNSFGA